MAEAFPDPFARYDEAYISNLLLPPEPVDGIRPEIWDDEEYDERFERMLDERYDARGGYVTHEFGVHEEGVGGSSFSNAEGDAGGASNNAEANDMVGNTENSGSNAGSLRDPYSEANTHGDDVEGINFEDSGLDSRGAHPNATSIAEFNTNGNAADAPVSSLPDPYPEATVRDNNETTPFTSNGVNGEANGTATNDSLHGAPYEDTPRTYGDANSYLTYSEAMNWLALAGGHHHTVRGSNEGTPLTSDGVNGEVNGAGTNALLHGAPYEATPRAYGDANSYFTRDEVLDLLALAEGHTINGIAAGAPVSSSLDPYAEATARNSNERPPLDEGHHMDGRMEEGHDGADRREHDNNNANTDAPHRNAGRRQGLLRSRRRIRPQAPAPSAAAPATAAPAAAGTNQNGNNTGKYKLSGLVDEEKSNTILYITKYIYPCNHPAHSEDGEPIPRMASPTILNWLQRNPEDVHMKCPTCNTDEIPPETATTHVKLYGLTMNVTQYICNVCSIRIRVQSRRPWTWHSQSLYNTKRGLNAWCACANNERARMVKQVLHGDAQEIQSLLGEAEEKARFWQRVLNGESFTNDVTPEQVEDDEDVTYDNDADS